MKAVVRMDMEFAVVALLVVTAVTSPAHAYSNSDLAKVRRGKNCPACDLSGANLSGANLSGINLSRANLSIANLSRTNLNKTNLSGVNLPGAELGSANLSLANLSLVDLSLANLSGANLSGANLSGAILLGTDFRNTKGMTQQQLEGKNAALLCSVALPKEIRVNPNRDCDRLPQELVNRRVFHSIFDAVEFVDVVRQKKWE